MPKIFQQESRVIALGEESNDMYISLDMIFLTSEVNLNNIQYSEDFIYGIESEKEKYIGLPLQCDVTKLEKGEYNKLTHKYNKKTKTFGTVSIGSFVDFKTQRNGDVLELVASCRIWKRNPKTCDALEELYGSDEGLKFSYEVLVGESTVENGITKVPKDDSNNPIGSCVVSTPAVPASTAVLLVAELSNQAIKGGEQTNMERTKETFTAEVMFANTKMNLAEINIEQVRKKIYAQLKTTIGDDYWYYDAVDMGVDYIVLQNYSTGDLMKVDYSVVDNEVVVSEAYPVDKTYIAKSKKEEELEMATIKELETKVTELETQIASLNTSVTQKDTLIAEKETALTSKETELAEVNLKVEVLSASVITKDAELVELASVKTSYDTLIAAQVTAENEVKKTALKDKFSKLLSAEVLKEVEIAEALENLDTVKLNARVVEIAMSASTVAKPKAEVTLASRITDNVKIAGAEPGSLREKYSI
jgi:hypothetical protein